MYDGEIGCREGGNYPRPIPTLQDGWVCPRWLSTVATKQKFGLGVGRPWQKVEKT